MTDLNDSPPPYGTVVFDCDSTLSRIEGIEELARDCRAEIEALTTRAMEGGIPLEEVYGARLKRIQPTRSDVAEVAQLYAQKALPNARELVTALHALGKRAVVVSGGLLPAVRPFAQELGITRDEDVQAVDIYFHKDDSYAGFDESSPLARGGGKIGVLRALAQVADAGALAFIGDGVTDLEAAPECARFIAYGGVVRRAKVFEAARVTCAFPDFAALVPLLFSEDELSKLSALDGHAKLLAAATPYSL